METIIFDCDGIITDFMKGFYDWYYNCKHNDQYGEISRYPYNWDFDFKGDPKIITQLISHFIESQPMFDLLSDEIPEAMMILKKKYVVNIVSHYPDAVTRKKNLDFLGIFEGIHYDNLYCLKSSDEKIDLIKEISPIHYFEDAPHIVKKVINFGCKINIYIPKAYPYSLNLSGIDLKGIFFYDNLMEIVDMII
jgi:hypothetical protein